LAEGHHGLVAQRAQQREFLSWRDAAGLDGRRRSARTAHLHHQRQQQRLAPPRIAKQTGRRLAIAGTVVRAIAEARAAGQRVGPWRCAGGSDAPEAERAVHGLQDHAQHFVELEPSVTMWLVMSCTPLANSSATLAAGAAAGASGVKSLA
jgi:hypothetical protein